MQHRTNNVIMKVICSISVHVQKLILFVYVYICILINLMFLFFHLKKMLGISVISQWSKQIARMFEEEDYSSFNFNM
jgi:hypothetical protein